MVYLLSSLLNSIQMLLYMFFMNAFFVRRHNSRLFWGYWLLWALIATVATNVFPSSIQLNGPFVFLMEIIILYGMNVTLYYGRWDRRLFTVVTSYAAIYSISSLMETLLLRITHMTRAEYLNNAPLYILFCFIRLGVLGIIVALINRFHAPLKELGKSRVWVPFATFSPYARCLFCSFFRPHLPKAVLGHSVCLLCAWWMSLLYFYSTISKAPHKLAKLLPSQGSVPMHRLPACRPLAIPMQLNGK